MVKSLYFWKLCNEQTFSEKLIKKTISIFMIKIYQCIFKKNFFFPILVLKMNNQEKPNDNTFLTIHPKTMQKCLCIQVFQR